MTWIDEPKFHHPSPAWNAAGSIADAIGGRMDAAKVAPIGKERVA